MAPQRAHWQVTITKATYDSWSDDIQQAFINHEGKYVNCEGPRIKLNYNDELTYNLAVGVPQNGYWHCLFSCFPGATCPIGRLRIVMEQCGMPIVKEVDKIEMLNTSPITYMKFANKKKLADVVEQVDNMLLKTFNSMKQKTVVSKERFVQKLCEEYGPTWITKNKTVIDTYCSIQEHCYKERIVNDVESDDDIEDRIKTIISEYHDNILYQLRIPGHYKTKCEALEGVSIDDVATYIVIISLIPYMFQRGKNVIDFIPGLYFWGDANAGKSLIFQLGKGYRTIACDATGIGKFKLETCEAGFLLDDVRADTVDHSCYLSTLRQLTLGAFTRIKVHSETRQVKGFIAVTSNERPNFLVYGYDQKNRDAWLRRFIVLEFKRNPEMDELIINGNELEYTIAQKTIAPFLRNLADDLLNRYGKDHRINKSINIYISHLDKYIDESSPESRISLPKTVVENGSHVDSTVGAVHKTKASVNTIEDIIKKTKASIKRQHEENNKKKEMKNKKPKIEIISDERMTPDSNGFELSNGEGVRLAEAEN